MNLRRVRVFPLPRRQEQVEPLIAAPLHVIKAAASLCLSEKLDGVETKKEGVNNKSILQVV
jgi:hypothetical protein